MMDRKLMIMGFSLILIGMGTLFVYSFTYEERVDEQRFIDCMENAKGITNLQLRDTYEKVTCKSAVRGLQ